MSKLREAQEDYGATATRMVELARAQDGFLGVSSARGANGVGITVSYFRSPEAIAAWRANVEHREAQRAGRARFYEGTLLTVARVERESSFGPDDVVELLRLRPSGGVAPGE